ncbi:MAG TPA: hypothetical protein DEO87_04070 [Lachnospiraceae bacterium]|nr:hypothetical protein [Lachnospiraceae bacterium]
MIIKNSHKFNKNKGFTLVELIVVLVLLGILVAMGVSGLLSWQDYSQFKQENTSAETIYYAVQNQFTEYGASGVFDDKVTSVVKNIGHQIGSPDNHNFFDGTKIAYGDKSGEFYKWQPDGSSTGTAIWINTPANLSSDAKKSEYQGSIYYISASKGDYDKYMKILNGESVQLAEDTKLLFEMITPYISDRSVLNGAILVEFSPEARQVFSVCYSDRADSFTYANGSGKVVSVLKRDEATRHEVMMGYFAADSLSVPVSGRSKGKTLVVVLKNGNVLELIITPESFSDSSKFDVKIYKASSGGVIDTNEMLGSFTFKATDIQNSLSDAAKSPAIVTLNKGVVEKTIRVPVWKNGSDIHVVLDAADAQAQSYMCYDYMKGQAGGDNFVNTFSFYRFGFDMENLTDIKCTVKSGNSDGTSNAESPVFAKVTKDESNKVYSIKNGRHLYNVRFETDYKDGDADRIFKLEKDIDWNEFIGKSASSDGINYYLNSYSNSMNSGINFDGLDYSINRVDSIISPSVAGQSGQSANSQNTANYAFPGFRALGKNDVFTGKKDDSDDFYTISNLTITYAANMAYGVYGAIARETWNDSDLYTYGRYPDENATPGSELNTAHKNANRGLYPLGLFAENLGTIEYLALNAHKVIGMEIIKDIEHDNKPAFVYTNMVGGFTGNNLGRLNNLKLRDVANLGDADIRSKEAGVTFVNGKTDVGGILGRESWTVYGASTKADMTFSKLENYGRITGMENVGGIVGRAYIIRDYLGDSNDKAFFKARFQNYDDGYDIYGEFEDGKLVENTQKSITGAYVSRAEYIKFSECISHGEVRGDDLIYAGNVVYVYETKYYANNATSGANKDDHTDQSNRLLRCSNIGGIAGIAMDGYYTDFNDRNWYGAIPQTTKIDNKDVKKGECMVIDKCNAYRLYSDGDLSPLVSGSGTKIAVSDIRNMLEHDYFVGGLVGYSRMALVSNSDNTVSEDEPAGYKAFVFGRNFVGGVFGCYDISKLSRDTLIESKYNIVNNNNVIGVMMVGGFSGGLGIGDESQKYFSFKHPSYNEGSLVSQTNGADPYTVEGIKNTGLVLGVKREALDYGTVDEPGLVMKQDIDIARNYSNFSTNNQYSYQGLGIKKNLSSPSGPDSNIGGIAGASRLSIKNADNIQSDEAKALLLELVGISTSTSIVSWSDNEALWTALKDSWNTSLYGGNGVGGIVGKTVGKCSVNFDNKVNAIVYGADCVGGIVGSNNANDETCNVAGVTLNSAVVIGRDMVGGLGGNITGSLSGTAKFENAYSVFGRYAVGGAVGASNLNKAVNVEITGAYVRGKAYVGGFVGQVSNSAGNMTGKVNKTTVIADFFAGGVAGSIYSSINSDNNSALNKFKVSVNNETTVTATRAFAGGFAGLYAHHYDGSNKQCLMVEKSDIYDYSLVNSNIITTTSYLVNLANILNSTESNAGIVNTIIDAETNGGFKTRQVSNITLAFDGGSFPSGLKSVQAGIFAGGVFGYIPNGLGVTIELGRTSSTPITTAVTTTGTIDASGITSSVFAESDKPENYSSSSKKYSYAGGVIGRVPEGVSIKQAAYSGALTAGSTYLGQIAEVNAGTISESYVLAFNANNSVNNVNGGLVGLNTKKGYITKDNTIVAESLSVGGSLGGLIGENWADYVNNDDVDRSLNGWTISCKNMSASGSVGAFAGYNYGKVDVNGSEISIEKVTGGIDVGAYFGCNGGEVYNSAVEKYINDNQETYRYSIKTYRDDLSTKVSITADGTDKPISNVGIIAGVNEGSIHDICISENKCQLDITGECELAGAVCGSAQYMKGLSRCINFMDVGDSSMIINTAGGITANINNNNSSNEMIISQLDNHGKVYASEEAAGIVGIIGGGENGLTITDCVNTGDIYSSYDVSGIASELYKEKVELCRNYGRLNSGSNSVIGVGSNADSVTKIKCLEAGGCDLTGMHSASLTYYVYGQEANPDSVQTGGNMKDESLSFPLQLYVYSGDDGYALSYHNGSEAYASGIFGLAYDPTSETDRYNVFDELDKKFMNLMIH